MTSRKTVQCKDCGYLALVHIDPPPRHHVFADYYPSKEVEFQRRQSKFWMHKYWPIRCHVGKADLDKELRTYPLISGGYATNANPTPGVTELKSAWQWRQVITQDRECDGFTPYMQGLSPDEHRAEERRRNEKRKDRRHEVWIITLTTLVTASLLTAGEVLIGLFWS